MRTLIQYISENADRFDVTEKSFEQQLHNLIKYSKTYKDGQQLKYIMAEAYYDIDFEDDCSETKKFGIESKSEIFDFLKKHKNEWIAIYCVNEKMKYCGYSIQIHKNKFKINL